MARSLPIHGSPPESPEDALPLFGKNPEKAAQAQAADAEVARLQSVPRGELAIELLPGLGNNGAHRIGATPGINLSQLMIWKMSAFPKATGYLTKLEVPFREAVQLLEHANLVERRTSRAGGAHFEATTLGEEAILAGNAGQYLAGQPGAAPR